MEISTILITILSLFANESPDLCADVYLDPFGSPYTDSQGQTLPKYCAWTGPDVPVWDGDICCKIDDDAAYCTTTDALGDCPSSGERRYCEYGEEVLGGGFVCYQPFPDACEAGYCVDVPPPPEVELVDDALIACCTANGCVLLTAHTVGDCEGDIVLCDWGISNEDGTVECFD